MTLLKVRAETLLANKISSSANEKPPVSGSRKKTQVVQTRQEPNQNQALFVPQFQAEALTMRGFSCPMTNEQIPYTPRPMTIVLARKREDGSSPEIE